MILHSLQATFGCLNQAELTLHDGLNIIEAPNESGKSTWLAFLRSMLYGLPTRERGALADKNHYMPWNGAAMKGRIDLSCDLGDLVLIRDTVHGGAPMGRFYAAYDGTNKQVPDMTGQNVGELLTGVSRPVFERSAFIRQSGLAIDQNSDLEKRIAALITSGEEDTSYTETKKRLRAALHQRRYNQSGSLPKDEAALQSVRADREKLEELRRQSAEDRTELTRAEAAAAEAREKLDLHDRIDVIEAKQQLSKAKTELLETRRTAEALADEMEREKIPPAETLMRIKFGAANLLTTQVSMNHVQAQAEEAQKQTEAAQKAVDALPFAPVDPETAAEKVRALSAEHETLLHRAAPSVGVIVLLTALAVLGLGAAAYYLALPYYICAGAILIPLLLSLVRGSSRKKSRAAALALLTPYGVASPEEIEPLLIQYNSVYKTLMEKKDAEAQITASWRGFYQNYKKLSEQILEETSVFCPDLENIHDISPLLEQGLRKRKALQTAQNRADQLEERCSALALRVPDDTPPTAEELALVRPAESRESLESTLQESTGSVQQLRSRIDRAEGEASAIGDGAELLAREEQLSAAVERAQEDYDAIALALDALEDANGELQNRFSPTLGRCAGEIFSELTGGKYRSVLLNEALEISAEGADGIPRESGLLSQGAADQLYLAVRLAILKTVLPAEKNVPLILDDTLTNFDDSRISYALDWLQKEAENRQILLFTCQNREAVYLQNAQNVHIISLEQSRRSEIF